MKMKTLFAALALTLTPALAFAQCMGDKHTTTSASACGDTMVYDDATRTCVLKPTS